jgi:F0F1-type ATP synthase membrane subunit b/b'
LSNVIKSNQIKSGKKVKLDSSNLNIQSNKNDDSNEKQDKAETIISKAQERADKIKKEAQEAATEIREEAQQKIKKKAINQE